MEGLKIHNSDFLSKIQSLIDASKKALDEIEADPDRDAPADKRYYVYAHIDRKTGDVFYIGKGTGRRAWAKDRQKYWMDYVDKINGEYDVKILADKLPERKALKEEDKYMEQFSKTIINWSIPIVGEIKVQLDDDINISIRGSTR